MRAQGDHHFVLSTDVTVYAYALTLGLSPAGDIRYGFDGTLGEDEGHTFTPGEREEIAHYMIAQWAAWGAQLVPAHREEG